MNEIEKTRRRLKLPGMATCWTSLCETHRVDKISFKDGLQLLLQTEQDTRKTNRIARLLKEASFPYPASFEELDYDTTRGIDAAVVSNLGTGEFIRSGATTVINGPAGTGKTYLAISLGDRAPDGLPCRVFQYAETSGKNTLRKTPGTGSSVHG